jgi:hypothetical protein
MRTSQEIALLRLVAQRLAGPRAGSPTEAVRWLLAAQGQELPGALTSVALRTGGGTRAAVESALDAGEVVRSWPMRGTLHLTAADDLPWMLDLLGGRALAGAASRRAALGMTDEDTGRARELAVAALTGGGRLSRTQLLAVLADGGVVTTGQRGYHLIWYLAQTGTLVMGPTAGGEQLFVLLTEWVPAPRQLEREEALGELALRFFRSHGPATVEDLVRWAGVLVRDVRAGLAGAGDRLAALDVDGVPHWMDPETPDRLAGCRADAERVLLLPGFDELVLGYADRTCTVPADHADRIVPGNNGVFRPTVVSGGRAVATWRTAGRGAARTLQLDPFTDLPAEVAAAATQAHAALP